MPLMHYQKFSMSEVKERNYTSHVIRSTSTIRSGMVFSAMWLEFEDMIHWSDEKRFLLHVSDGRMRVWRQKNTVYTPGIPSQPPLTVEAQKGYGGVSLMIASWTWAPYEET